MQNFYPNSANVTEGSSNERTYNGKTKSIVYTRRHKCWGYTQLVQIGTVVSEKIPFEFLYVHDFGPRSRNVLDLQYSHTFIYSIRSLLLLTFRSLAAIVSEKSTVFTFSYRKY